MVGTVPDQLRDLGFSRPVRQATADGRTEVVLSTDGHVCYLPMNNDLSYRVEAVVGASEMTDIACQLICYARRADGSIWSIAGSGSGTLRRVAGVTVP